MREKLAHIEVRILTALLNWFRMRPDSGWRKGRTQQILRRLTTLLARTRSFGRIGKSYNPHLPTGPISYDKALWEDVDMPLGTRAQDQLRNRKQV